MKTLSGQNGDLALPGILDPGLARAHLAKRVKSGQFYHSGENVHTDCPFCGKQEHFTYHVNRRIFNCYRCGNRGRIMVDLEIPGTGDQRGKLNARPNRPIPRLQGVGEGGNPWHHAAIRYLTDRNVSLITAKRFKLAVAPPNPRVIFPFWDELQNVTFAHGRHMGTGEPKYLSWGRTPALFGTHVYRDLPQTVIVVEGPFDCMAVPESVAMLGSSLQWERIKKMSSHHRLVFLPDRDNASYLAGVLVKKGFTPSVVRLPDSRDPADLGPHLLNGLVAEIRSSDIRGTVDASVTSCGTWSLSPDPP